MRAGDVVVIANYYVARLADVGVALCDAAGLRTHIGVLLRRAPDDAKFSAPSAIGLTASGEAIAAATPDGLGREYFDSHADGTGESASLWWVRVRDRSAPAEAYVDRIYPERDLATNFLRPYVDVSVA